MKIKGLLGVSKFWKRTLLIYMIGGVVPFVIAGLYTNQLNQQNMVEMTKKMQVETLSLMKTQISESTRVVDDVAGKLYRNQTVKRMTRKKYKTIEEFDRDCEKLTFIDQYIKDYKYDIASITIYVNNKPINTNKYFSYLGENAKSEKWFRPTCEKKGEAYWSYVFDQSQRGNYIQVTRAITDYDGNIEGVLAVRMQNTRIKDMLESCSADTAILFGNGVAIYNNYDSEKNNGWLEGELDGRVDKSFSGTITRGVSDYLLSYERIYPLGSTSYYTIVSLSSYQELLVDINMNSLKGYMMIIAGLVVSLVLIAVYSYYFGKRMTLLRQQMHLVAIGEYDEVQPVGGDDEITEIYNELEKMKEDNRQLMERMVEEEVQKEKLHTKQKEVEFKMLASQINPHFLYNTLETIRMKAVMNKEPEIEDLVKMLAKIMRRNIQVSKEMVTLKSEIELVKYYLKIQNYRFGDRIYSEVEVADDIDLSAKVLPLIIQPFVENAFAHGLEAKESDGKLKITVEREVEVIKITVSDNGEGMSYYQLGKLRHSLKEMGDMDGNHIGVRNVNQRIKLQFGEKYGVWVDSEQNRGTKVTITMPYYWGTEY